MDPERVEFLRNRHLLLAPEDDSGLLFAVAEGDVMNLEVAAKGLFLPDFRQV